MAICYLVGAMGGGACPNLQEGDTLYSVDGGLVQVEAWGLKPQVLLGDFDSLGYLPQGDCVHALPCEKDETDMEYAVKLGFSQGYRQFFLLGAFGGRFDHSWGNIQILLQIALKGGFGILVGEEETALVLSQGTLSFPGECQGTCSVFALGGEAKGVHLRNLRYSGENFHLLPSQPLGVSNEFLPGKSAEISVKEGNLLVIFTHQPGWEGYFSLLSAWEQKNLQGGKES